MDIRNNTPSRVKMAPLSKQAIISAIFSIYWSFALGVNAVILIPQGVGLLERDNAAFAYSWVALHVLGLSGLIAIRRVRRLPTQALVGFCALFLSSVIWSVSPGRTLVYAGMLASNAVFAYVVAHALDLKSALRLCLKVLLFWVVAGLVAYAVGYEAVLYLDDHQRLTALGTTPIRGFFSHKITAALYANIGIILAFFLVKSKFKWMLVGIFLGFIILTGSATGLVLTGVFGATVLYYKAAIGARGSAVTAHMVLLFIGAGCFVALSIGLELLLNSLGRDVTLTGRTLLWAWALDAWWERPFAGWGFTSYFDSTHALAAKGAFYQFTNWEVPHFHSAYLQTAVDFGIIGLAVLFLHFGFVLFKLYKGALGGRVEAFAALVVVVLLVVGSATMHLAYNYNHAGTFLLFYVLFRCLASSYRRL